MQHSHLAIVHTRYSIETVLEYQRDGILSSSLVDAICAESALLGRNAAVCSIPSDGAQTFENIIFGDSGAPDGVDYFEIIEVSSRVACAPPIERIDDEGWEFSEGRPSSGVSRMLGRHFETGPSRGRRLMFIAFELQNFEQDSSHHDSLIRRRLNNVRCVLSGHGLRGYCFVSDETPELITRHLGDYLTTSSVLDYLVCEPLAVAFSSLQMSPLKEWVERDYAGSAHATIRPRKTRKT